MRGRRDSVAPAATPWTIRALRCDWKEVPELAAQMEAARSRAAARMKTGRLREQGTSARTCIGGSPATIAYRPNTNAMGIKTKFAKPVNSEGQVRSLATSSGAIPSAHNDQIQISSCPEMLEACWILRTGNVETEEVRGQSAKSTNDAERHDGKPYHAYKDPNSAREAEVEGIPARFACHRAPSAECTEPVCCQSVAHLGRGTRRTSLPAPMSWMLPSMCLPSSC